MSLPWKHAAKLYRNKYRVKSRKCERQRKQITMLLKQSKGRSEHINKLKDSAAVQEELIKEVVRELRRNEEW